MERPLSPESKANLQLTYGHMYLQWASGQKFGGMKGDRFMPHAVYKHQLNSPHHVPTFLFLSLLPHVRETSRNRGRGGGRDRREREKLRERGSEREVE
jgi:hypothetical protein